MSITTWAQFQQQLTRLLDGEDVSQTTITPNTLAQIISLAERRIYRETRTRWNEKPFSSLPATNNLCVLPADFVAPNLVHFGKSALEPATEEFVRDHLTTSCVTRYFAFTGQEFTFGGPVADGTALQGSYYYRLPDLSATTLPTNMLFLKETDLFIFGCLAQAAPFFDQDARLQLWDGRYSSLRDELNLRHERSAISSGRIMRRPSAAGFRIPPKFTAASPDIGDYVDDYSDNYA